MKKFMRIILALILLLSLTACGGSSEPAPTDPPPEAPQEAPEPAPTPEPPPTPEPEPEPEPVDIPEPVVYTGIGDDVIEIQPFDIPWVMFVSGNASSSYFSVKGYDKDSNSTELFVSTTEAYEGFVLDPSQSTTFLEIKAEGEWTVAIDSFYSLPVLEMETKISGTGDDVFFLNPADGLWFLKVIGNADAGYFSVKGYDEHLSGTELFVSTTEEYSGITLDATQQTVLLQVKAESDWTIQIADISELVVASKGNTISGTGDVVFLVHEAGQTAAISSNNSGGYFSVKTYGNVGDELLVSTTDPYEGRVMLKGDPFVFVIKAEDDWSISFE